MSLLTVRGTNVADMLDEASQAFTRLAQVVRDKTEEGERFVEVQIELTVEDHPFQVLAVNSEAQAVVGICRFVRKVVN